MDHPRHVASARGDDHSLLLLKRRIYGAYLAATMVGIGLIWLFPPSGTPVAREVVGLVVPPSLVALGVLLYLLGRYPASVPKVERSLYYLTYPVFLSVPLLTLVYGGDGTPVHMAMRSIALWSPVAVVWAFVAYGSRGGVVAASAFLLAMSAVLTTVGGVAAGRGLALPVVAIDVEYLVASGVLVAALYALAAFLERQTAARAAAEAEAHFALVDPLTGLWNRRALEPHVTRAIALARREGRSVAVCFVDLDTFKDVNDTYGHGGGDAVLVQFGTRLSRSVREADVVARIGGDEFAVVALVRDAGEAHALAEKLLGVTSAPFEVGDAIVAVTMSVGVSVHPDDGTTPGELLRHADAAMYRAKAGGRDRWAPASLLPAD